MIRKFQSIFDLNSSWKISIRIFLASRIFYAIWSFVILHYFPVSVAEVDFQNQPLLAVFNLRSGDGHIYSRMIGGQIRNFDLVSENAILDQTGTTWSFSCQCAIGGPDMGKKIQESSLSTEEFYPYKGVPAYPVAWIGIWQRFDANWYGAIASYGYGKNSGDVHFPPLYPAMISLLLPLAHHPFLAGIFLSHIFTLLMLVVLHGYVSRNFNESIATKTLIYLMIFPTAFFFYTAYTESLFILLALLFFYALQDKNWGYAGLWIFGSILTRLQGVVLFFPLLFELYRHRKQIRLKDIIFSLGLPVLSAFIYLFIRWSAGDASVIPFSEANLHARQGFPWENYWYAVTVLLSGKTVLVDVLNLIATTLFVFLAVRGWRYFDLPLNLFLAASLIVFTSRLVETQPLNSMIRYVLTLFPVFILLAIYGSRNPMINRIILYVGAILSLFLSAQFWLWGWVG